MYCVAYYPLSVIGLEHAALLLHANRTSHVGSKFPPNNLANRGLLAVGPSKVNECGIGSVNIWAAGLWRGSERTRCPHLMSSENKQNVHVFRLVYQRSAGPR